MNRNRFVARTLSAFLLLLLNVKVLASLVQTAEPVYRRYTVDDGLPSSMVYHVFQDSKGYMWFATANGVSRYDGYKFENFDIQSGLVDNDVFEIYEDYKHRIWFIPMSGKLCYLEKDRIVKYKYNSMIEAYTPTIRGPIKGSFYVDSMDNVFISIKQFCRFSISADGVYKKYEDKDKAINLLVDQLPNGKILISNPNTFIDSKVAFHGLYQNIELKTKDIFGNLFLNPHHLFFLPTPDSAIICSIYKKILKIKNGKIVISKNTSADVIWMSFIDNDNLWVSPQEGGIQCYPKYNIEKDPSKVFLKDSKISSVLKDKEGAYWFSSLNDGVFYCSDIDFANYTKENGLKDNRINAVAANADGVYIGYEFGYVDLLKKDKVKHFYSLSKDIKNPSVRKFFLDSLKNKVWVSSIVNLFWLQKRGDETFDLQPSYTRIFPKQVLKSISGEYWIATTRGLMKCTEDKIIYESYANNDFKGVIYDLVEDKDGVVWFCTINGLWNYYEGNYHYFGTDNRVFSETSYSLIQNPIDSSLWIGTNGAGIVIKKDDKVSQITKKDGLISNSVYQLCYSKKNVWVATRQGLSKIAVKDGKYSIVNFTTANGLPTNEVSSICEYNDVVYVGTPKGLTIFNKNGINEYRTPPNIIISNFRANNNSVDLQAGKIELAYDQNSLKIDFVGFVYRNDGKVNYRYRMIGIDTTWTQTQTPNCLYNGLTSGRYVFEVETQSYNGVWSLKPASIAFTIHPPFWKTFWFLALGTIIFSSFIFLVYKVRITEINRRNNLLQNINLYKQQSLRQQMNPHFIFNTLNSIQLYILEKDSISSHKYLTKFARLMRMTLDNSLYSTIPLRDEIEALKLYLDLEKLRLEDKFNYYIDYEDNESMLYYKIPTLLIQPFVENSIWHGISHRQDQMGWVKISLVDNNDSTMTCVVEDNGVGRKLAGEVRQMRNKDHKSRGSQITQQRIDLLSMMYGEKFSVYYDDPIDSDGVSLGTKVSIIIPKEI